MPLISVVIPIYNSELGLKRCIDSILSQTVSDFEVICVNDGSTDSSLTILENAAMLDSRICVLNQENTGAASARNLGISHASGEYLLMIDADDFVCPQLLEKCLSCSQDASAEVVVFGHRSYHEETGLSFAINNDWIERRFQSKVFNWKTSPDYFFQAVQNFPWNKFYSMPYIKARGFQFQDLHLTEDLMFSLPACIEAKKVAFLNEDLIVHREGLSTNLMSMKDQYPFDFIEAFACFHKYLIAQGLDKELFDGFAFWAIDGAKYNLTSMKTDLGAYAFFNSLHKRGFSQMGINGLSDSYFAERSKGLFEDESLVSFYQHVTEGNFEKLLFSILREQRSCIEIERSRAGGFFEANEEARSLLADSLRERNTLSNDLEQAKKQIEEGILLEKSLRNEIKACEDNLAGLQKQLDSTKNEYESWMNSTEMKIGRIACTLPRAIQRWTTKDNH